MPLLRSSADNELGDRYLREARSSQLMHDARASHPRTTAFEFTAPKRITHDRAFEGFDNESDDSDDSDKSGRTDDFSKIDERMSWYPSDEQSTTCLTQAPINPSGDDEGGGKSSRVLTSVREQDASEQGPVDTRRK